MFPEFQYKNTLLGIGWFLLINIEIDIHRWWLLHCCLIISSTNTVIMNWNWFISNLIDNEKKDFLKGYINMFWLEWIWEGTLVTYWGQNIRLQNPSTTPDFFCNIRTVYNISSWNLDFLLLSVKIVMCSALKTKIDPQLTFHLHVILGEEQPIIFNLTWMIEQNMVFGSPFFFFNISTL